MVSLSLKIPLVLKTDRNKICLLAVENNSSHSIESYVNEYPNLMLLLRDRLLLDDFGQCGGVGRCATCVIAIEGLKGSSIRKERNEHATLSKMDCTDDAIRLSCQLYVNWDIDGAQIELLDI